MIVKVKEPQAVERAMLREGQILFTYLHLAPDFPQTEELIKSKAVCIAYETVTDHMGRLPLLAPMSEVAGRMSIKLAHRLLRSLTAVVVFFWAVYLALNQQKSLLSAAALWARTQRAWRLVYVRMSLSLTVA